MTILYASTHHDENPIPQVPLPRILSMRDVMKNEEGMPAGFESKLMQVREYIREHYGEPITLTDLAKYIGSNEHKLKMRFKQRYDITVFRYLQKVRMNNASYMLKIEKKPVKEVAYLVGYSNIANFTNAFKGWYGYPPSTLLREGKA